MASFDSGAIKAVMESPIPIAALSIVCFVAWRQMSLVSETVKTTISTFKEIFKTQSDKQDSFLAAFSAMGKKVDESQAALLKALQETNASVSALTVKIDKVPDVVNATVETKLLMQPKIGDAVEQRFKELESKNDVQTKNTEIILEAIRKKFAK